MGLKLGLNQQWILKEMGGVSWFASFLNIWHFVKWENFKWLTLCKAASLDRVTVSWPPFFPWWLCSASQSERIWLAFLWQLPCPQRSHHLLDTSVSATWSGKGQGKENVDTLCFPHGCLLPDIHSARGEKKWRKFVSHFRCTVWTSKIPYNCLVGTLNTLKVEKQISQRCQPAPTMSYAIACGTRSWQGKQRKESVSLWRVL